MVSTGGSRIPVPSIVREVILRGVRSLVGMAQQSEVEIRLAADAEIPTEGAFIFACNYPDRGAVLQVCEVLARACPQLRVEPVVLPAEPPLSSIPGHSLISRDWKRLAERIGDGQRLLVFPEGTRSPDGMVHKGERGIGWLVLSQQLEVIPLALSQVDRSLTIGRTLQFSRFHGLDIDRSLTRAVTDEVMTAIVELSGRAYSDVYAITAQAAIARRAREKVADARRAARQRRVDEREAKRRRLEEAELERLDLSQRARVAAEAAREHARLAASCENSAD